MAAYTRKQYSGAARNTTTTTLLTNVGTTVDIAATTGWPSIAGIPFYVVINPSSIYEEKCLATISGSTLTLTRAQDDTTASEHPIGSVIYPVFTANDADEANELVSKLTTKGDLLVTDGNGLFRLGVGTDGYFLKANNSASVGVEWASIPTINNLNDIGDVTIVDAEEGDFLVYKNSASAWINETIHFITVSDTEPTDEIRVGDLWYNSSELELYTYYSGSWIQVTLTPEFLKVEELDNVYIGTASAGDVLAFDGLDWYNDNVVSLLGPDISAETVTASVFTGNLTGNSDTATALETPRTISLSGDLSGSASFNGASDITISASVVNSGVSLDEISDVVITSPEEFQSLVYDGTNFVNQYASVVTYVRNAEATTLTTGTVVYLFGATGDHASVKRADNDSDVTSSKTVGIVAASIASAENGPVVTRGYVYGINLSVGYSAGDVLWLGDDGAFTKTKPTAPEHLVFVGVVVRATSNGIVYVATQNGYELDELHDVKINGVTDGQFLRYNSASTVWVNDEINLGTDTVGNYMSDLTQGTGITITHTPGEGSNATIAIGQAVDTSASVAFANLTVTGDLSVSGTSTILSTSASVSVGSFPHASYRSAEFLVQVSQGSKYTVLKALMLHDGTTANLVQYGLIEIGATAIPLTLGADISGANARLNAAITDAGTTNATVRVVKTTIDS